MTRTRSAAEQAFLVDYLRTYNVKLKAGADDGILRIIEYGFKNGYSVAEIAYNLATGGHETAWWYQPIREGATRHGPNFTDAQAQSAVRNAMQKGLIKLDYVSPINGRSYYGRGLVQITWLDNYRKFERILGKPLVANPDLALEWDTALHIMYEGINKGHFRKDKFSDFVRTGEYPTLAAYTAARNIVNGDVRKNGPSIAKAALQWLSVLKEHEHSLKNAYAPKSTNFLTVLLNVLFGWKRK